MRKALVLALMSAIAVAVLSAAGGATAQRYAQTCPLSAEGCYEPLKFDLGGSITPSTLLRHVFAPVAFEIHGKVENDGHPPALREAIVGIASGVAIDSTGFPACRLRQLEKRRIAAARRLCEGAVVGGGVAHVGFAPSEEPVEAPLTLFNGDTQGGVTRLFVHSVIAAPEPIPVISTAKIRKRHHGLEVTWRIPPILDGSGSLLDFRLRIKRRFTEERKGHSYVAARCADGRLRATASLLFRNDARSPGRAATTVLKGDFSLPCSSTRGNP